MSATSSRTLGNARAVTIELPDQLVAAVRTGPEAGPPVLLVPGYTGSKEDFGPVLDPLGAAGFAVTAIDLPGQFESPGVDDPGAYAPDRLGRVVRALAHRAGRPVHLLGHSFGGLVARAAVIAEPGAFASLVLLSSGPAHLGGERRNRMDRLEPLLLTHSLPELHAVIVESERSAPGYAPPPPEVAEFVARRFAAGHPAMLQGMADALRREPDRVAELAATGVPVLVAHGADDDAWPPVQQADMARRLAARYAVIDAAAHSPAVENPAATVAVLREFWGGASAAAPCTDAPPAPADASSTTHAPA